MALSLLDSSAVIAYLDADDDLHDSAVSEVEATMRAGNALAICAVTWAELLNGAALGHRAQAAVRAFAEDFAVAILSVDAGVAERAAALQAAYAAAGRRGERRRLRTPDALILATALEYGTDTVIGGDDKWPKVPDVGERVVLLTA